MANTATLDNGHNNNNTGVNGNSGRLGSVEQQEEFGAYYKMTHTKGISNQEVIEGYSEWANNYDAELCPGRYNGPEIAADALATHFGEGQRAGVKVLDVAAGTGRVGDALYSRGFRCLDALEPAAGMLKVLNGRGIYQKQFQVPIGYEPIREIPSNTYDAVIISGGMGEGHIPVQAVDEMIRVVRPGGVVLIVMREEYLSHVQEYVDKLEPHMDALEGEGLWKSLSRRIVPEYSLSNSGVLFKYEVLVEST